jgi:hypothetical protein
MYYQEVSYVRLSSVEKTKALEILGRGNVLLKKWFAFFPSRNFRYFRKAIMNGSMNPEYKGKPSIPLDKLEEFHNDLPIMKAARYNVIPELGNRTVEQAILEGYSALAKHYVKKWFRRNDFSGITKSDFLQEAYMQIIESIYSWMPDRADITTFIWYSLKNKLSNVSNTQGKFLSHLVNRDLAFLIKNKKENQKTNMSNQDQLRLKQISNVVYCESYLCGKKNLVNNDKFYGDYTSFRDNIESEPKDINLLVDEDYLKNLFEKAKLNIMERELVEISMDSSYGWKAKYAKNHINPITKKPYSRVRINQIFQLARKKIANVLEN